RGTSSPCSTWPGCSTPAASTSPSSTPSTTTPTSSAPVAPPRWPASRASASPPSRTACRRPTTTTSRRGAHHPHARRGQGAPRPRLPRHLRQHLVQPRPPRPLPWPRRGGRRPGLLLRHHPGRPAAVRRRRRHAGHRVAVQVHHGDLPRAIPPPPRGPQRRRPARDLRRLRHRHGFLHGGRQGARPPLCPAVDGQRHQLPRLPPLPP
uniref:Uncharacterized protein n=1 Tax=Triticum urartu TaxID=4572 RepID=A0A8R7R8V7_TRIUA